MPGSEKFRELISKAKSGDKTALEQLLLAHYDRLARHISPRLPESLKPLVAVDDILQQTFLQVFRDIGRFEPASDGAFFAWLKTIAEHRMLDTVKALRRKKRGGDWRAIPSIADSRQSSVANLVEMLSAGTHRPSRSVARREAVQAVQVALAGLPEDYRQAIQLMYLEGKGLEEVPNAIGRSPGAVRGLVRRAKEKMRAVLGRSSLWFTRK